MADDTHQRPRGGRACRRCPADRERGRRARGRGSTGARKREYMRTYRRKEAMAAAAGKSDVAKEKGSSSDWY